MWLYVPNTSTSSPSAPEAEDSISASSWQFKALEQSVWWRGKPSQSRHWYQRWSKASFIQLLCGRMPEPSTAAHGVARWTASLAASRASLTASPESDSGKKTSATSGPTLAGSSFNPVRGSSSSRMSVGCFLRAVRNESGETFTDWASRLREDCSRRQKLATAKTESGSFSLLWPAPAARDYKGTNSPDHLQNGTGRLHLDQLPNFVEHVFSPQLQAISTGGEQSRPSRRTLNPSFVEWLMGWPTGWTDFACSETELSRFKQRMRSALLSLGLPRVAPPAQLALFG